MSTTHGVVVVPSSQHISSELGVHSNSFDIVTNTGILNRSQPQFSKLSTSTTASASPFKSFVDYRPLRTGSNEAVIGENTSITTSTSISNRSTKNSSQESPLQLKNRINTLAPTSLSAIDSTRPRSLSAGRTRVGGGGVDLVQQIYDRLGIHRGELASSKSKGTGSTAQKPDIIRNYKIDAMTKSTTSESNGSGRGRATVADNDNDIPIRSRSLSRGRQFRSIWPPQNSDYSSGAPKAATEPLPQSPCRRTDVALDPIISPKQQRTSVPALRSPEDMAAAMLSPSRYTEHRAKNQQLDDAAAKRPKHVTALYQSNSALNIDKNFFDISKNEVNSPEIGDSFQNPPVTSVKERMRAFSEPTKKTTPSLKSKPTVITERKYPPLIDIFADERKRNQNDEDSLNTVINVVDEEEKKDDDTSYNKSVVKQMIQRRSAPTQTLDSPKISTSSPSASRGKGTQLANAFLTAIQTSPTNNKSTTGSPRYAAGPTFTFAPINEIATDDQGSIHDTGSVSILSSVCSHDEQHPSSMNIGSNGYNGATMTHARKASWLDNRSKIQHQQQRGVGNSSKVGTSSILSIGQPNFVPPSATTTTTTSSSNQSGYDPTVKQPLASSSTTSIVIERMVEERVQARIAELERRMEQQMRIYMEEMEAKMVNRIANNPEKESGA